MATQIRDFKQECFDASGFKFDHRWQKYARWITGINEKGIGGYAFEGTFVDDGTSKVEVGERKLIMVCSETGSAKYRTKDFCFLILEPDGTLTRTDIEASDEKKGWHLRVIKQVKDLLNEFTSTPTQVAAPAKPTLNMHGDHVATCLCCRHYDNNYDAGYSDVTPGIGTYFLCQKKHFTFVTASEQHEVISQGETCPDFSPHK